MVAPDTITNGQVIDLTEPPPDPETDLGLIELQDDGTWRWDCGACVGRSVGTYPTFLTAYQALKLHREAGEVFHR